MRYGLKLSIILSFLFSTAWAAETLKWESWLMNQKAVVLEADDEGNLHGIIYKKEKPIDSTFYHIKNSYTCAPDLKANYNANCQNTCFPSHNQKGVDFTLKLLSDAKYVCKQKVENTKYLGFSATTYKLDCGESNIEITAIPELEKYQNQINEGSNNYFKTAIDEFKIKGFISRIILQEKNKNSALFYEAKNLRLEKEAPAMSFPKNYNIIQPEPFLTEVATMEKEIGSAIKKQADLLYEKKDAHVELALAAIKKECITRFPAVKNDMLLIELCKTDKNVQDQLYKTVWNWFNKIQEEIASTVNSRLTAGTKHILEKHCNK